jgi:hypothetical protein
MIPETHTRASSGRGFSQDARDERGLEVFVGTWKTEGQQYAGAFGPDAEVTARETYEWLTGGKFLIHRLEGSLGGAPMACIEIIGHDLSSDTYRMHTFYNEGTSQVWRLVESDDGNWIISADWPTPDGSKRQVRCVHHFEDGGKTRTGTWQSSSDGTTWDTFWKVTSTKVNGEPGNA